MERLRLKPKNTTRLDDDTIDQFCELVREGLPFDACCDYLGISSTTFYAWLDKGKKYLANGGNPDEHEMCGRFYQRVRRAHAEYRRMMNQRAHSGAPGTWVRDVTILERRDRRNYGRYEPEGGNDEQYDVDERFL